MTRLDCWRCGEHSDTNFIAHTLECSGGGNLKRLAALKRANEKKLKRRERTLMMDTLEDRVDSRGPEDNGGY